MTECRTIGISIGRQPDPVYDFLASPANFPKWSEFITEMKKDGDAWLATTPKGIVRIKFAPRNEFRVADHWVTVNPGLTVHMPVRVLPNAGDGTEVTFTIFRLAGMSDREFEEDIAMVRKDLACLKRVLELSRTLRSGPGNLSPNK